MTGLRACFPFPIDTAIGRVLLAIVTAILVLADPALAQNNPPPAKGDFTLDNPLLYIPYGAKETTESDVPLRFSGQVTGADPMVEDAQKTTGGAVVSFTVGSAVQFDTGPGWLMTVSVKDADRILIAETRNLTIRYGGQIYRKSYKLEPATAGAATLTLSPPVGEWLWHGDSGPKIPLQVMVGSDVLRNVRIVSSGLQDRSSKATIPNSFLICKDAEPCGSMIPEVRGPGLVQMALQLPDGPPSPGVYEGTFALAADGQTTPASFTVKVDATSWAARIVGILLVVAGTLAGLFLAYGISARTAMLQAERPAAVLRARVAQGVNDLQGLKAPFSALTTPSLDAAFGKLATELSDEKLKEFGVRTHWWELPETLSIPLDSTGLTAHLGEVGKEQGLVDLIVKRGMAAALADVPPGAVPAAVATAVKDLDGLADRSDLTDGVTMLAAIQAILATLAKSQESSTFAAINQTAAPTSWTVEEIDLAAGHVGLTWLLIAGLLTSVIGSYILVLNNPGFGRIEDLVTCFLWGLGFSTGAGAMTSSTADEIRTKIAIPHPI